MFVIISKPDCPWCEKAKSLLRSRDESFSEFSLANHPIFLDFLRSNKLTTVPQIYYDGGLVGGYTDLEDWFELEDAFADEDYDEQTAYEELTYGDPSDTDDESLEKASKAIEYLANRR